MPFTDLQKTAKWRDTFPLKPRDFFARFNRPRHPLLLCKLVTKHFYRIDPMHAFDNNGLAGVVAGSVFSMVVLSDKFAHTFGDTQQDRLDFLNNLMRAWQDETKPKTRMPPFFFAKFYFRRSWV